MDLPSFEKEEKVNLENLACEICDKRFNTSTELEQHFAGVHED